MGRGRVRRCGFVAISALMLDVAPALAETPSEAPSERRSAKPQAAALVRDLPEPVDVSLTADGFVPERITVVPGQTIVFANESGATRAIGSGGDGTFESGPVAPGGRYALAFPISGTWTAHDDATPLAHAAAITVGRLQLDGADTDQALAAIPDESPPDGAVPIHPEIALQVTRNRILISFTPNATVEQANAALDAAGLTIVGGNRDAQVLVTEVADAGTPTLEYMQVALDTLRAMPGVRTAAYDISLDPESTIPRPPSPDPGAASGNGPYTWDVVVSPDDTMRGAGTNHGLEAARFPQAWNWLDAVRRVTPANMAASATVVLDNGFDVGHPDLAKASLQHLCTALNRCTTNPPRLDAKGQPANVHGTATAGIVGAVFDRGPPGSTAQGTTGGDPASEVHMVPFFVDQSRTADGVVAFFSFLDVLDVILDEKGKPGSNFPNLRVINLSAGNGFFADDKGIPIFEHKYGNSLCGQGADDDATTPVANRVPCTPNNKDSYLKEFHAAAELLRPLADRLAANNVLLVVAAGNDGEMFCATRPRPDLTAPCPARVAIRSSSIDSFAYLASIWPAGTVPPWVIVEAVDAVDVELVHAPYSNIDGTISADGTTLVPTVTAAGVSTWTVLDGTSMAAPFVSAAAGLLSNLSPSWTTVRSLLVDRGPIDVPGSPTPRLDVFSSMLGLPGGTGVDVLLDVNDDSPDGNRRVTYDDRGQPTGQDTISGSTTKRTADTAPDQAIDMRDFRRYRDAWLGMCAGRTGCPLAAEIALDGTVTHPKKDTNLDGCFAVLNTNCSYGEHIYSRFDFNGDGTLLADRAFPILLDANGQPTARGAGSRMTDLDVLQTRFGTGNNPDTEGWTAADLDRLMVSADVELRLDQLWAGGVTSAEVTVATVDGTGPRLTYTPRGPGDIHVYTVPIDPVPEVGNSDLIQVRVVGQLPGDTSVTYLSPPIEAKAGQDIVVVPCTDQLVVSAAPEEVTPGGDVLIQATLTDCTGRPVAGAGIDFEALGAPNGSSLSVVNAFTDGSGVARTVFTYPDGINSPAQVVARAFPAIDGGERLERVVDIGPAADLVIHYRFRQTILDYERTSTNDWGPGEDDCDGVEDAGNSPAKCFTATQTIDTQFGLPGLPTFDLALGELERRGTIQPNGLGGATVDDNVGAVQRETSTAPEAFDLRGIHLTTVVEEWDPLNPADRETKSYTSPIGVSGQPSATVLADLPAIDVPSIEFSITDQQLRVDNLRAWGDGYAVRQEAYTLQDGFTILPEDTNPDLPVPNLYQPLQQIVTDLALVPRSDSSSFAWGWDPDAPLTFAGNGDGTYEPVSWCGTRQRLFDNADDPGYWSDSDPAIETTDPIDASLIIPGPYRDPDEQRPERAFDDRAAPRHSGSVTSRFEFVAVVTRGGDPVPTLEFDSCTETEPAPVVGWRPGQPVEGQPVEFFDLSSYAATAIGETWRFGDPAGPDPATNQHIFSDNGTYAVDVTVTDAGGASHDSEIADVVVKNAPPTLEVVEVTGGGRAIKVAVDDAGTIDRQQLEVRLTSPTPGWPAGGIAAYTSPPTDPMTNEPMIGPWAHTVLLPQTLAPGVYFVVLTVLDKDGGTAAATFSLAVNPPDAGGQALRSSAGTLDSTVAEEHAEADSTAPADVAAQADDPAPVDGAAQADDPEPADVAAPTDATGGRAFLGAARRDAPASFVAPQATAAAALAADSQPPAVPVPAVVVDRGAVATGELVTARNASRANGAPVAALLDPGDGRSPVALLAGAAAQLAYGEAGTPVLAIAAGGVTAGVALSVTGPSIPASVAYSGVTTAPQGADAAVAATVTRAGGVALPGVVVRFSLGGEQVEAISGGDGVARAELSVTGATGVRQLTVTALPDGAPINVDFTVTANAVPTVDAGGPYTIGAGAPLTLTATATDADPGEAAALLYEWDLDQDGVFDDATGPEPSLPASAVATVVCGGVCDAGEIATVAARVTDVKGGRAVDTATVTIVRDFAITINPPSATLVPNANVSFTVGVVTTNGFTGPVALTTPGLPAGITATFDPPTVTPNGMALLNLRAGATFVPQDFALVVRGTSGSLVREAGSDLSLEFGLIPQCFGTVTGRVTDEATGAGMGGITVLGTQTAADGTYTATNLALEAGNAPRQLSISSLGSEYYPLSPPALVRIACGVTSTLDIQLLRRQFGAIQGTITGIDADGTPLGPVNQATFALNRRTGPDGRYSLTNLALGAGNTPITSGVAVSATGFHSRSAQVEIRAGETSTLDIVLRKVCTGSIRVRVLDQRTGKPVEAAQVDLGAGTTGGGITDANGIFVITGVGLNAPDNAPATRSVRARTPTGISPLGIATKSVVVGGCGVQAPVDVAIPFPRRVEAVANVLVVDDTGTPVPNATVRIGGTSYSGLPTGADGRVRITHLLGFDVPPTLTTTITAFATGMVVGTAQPLTLREDQPTSVTVILTKTRYGAVEGTVRDRASGAPISGVTVNGRITGADGRYRIDTIALNGVNEPRQFNVSAFDPRNPIQYWTSPVATVTVRADEVTQVPDLLMIRVCAPATIRGRVINAATRAPIDGALVRAGSRSTTTDADGRFVLTDVQVGTDNANLQYTVIASKTGFITAQKDVTVGCGADIVVDFGRDGDGFGTIAGRVTDEDGNPVNGVSVTTGFGGAARTNTNGQYTIANAPAGDGGAARDWTVSFTPPTASALQPASTTATVRRDETTQVDVVLQTLTDDPPVAASFALTIEPGPVAVTLAGADPTGDPLTYTVTAPPANGTLSGTAPNLTYTPAAGFAGVDTIEYTVSDATNTSAPGVVTITVLAANRPPVARITGNLSVGEGTSANLSASTSSDDDPGAVLTYSWDLDGDGQYDDDTGVTTSVRERDDATITIGLRAADERGGVGTTTATLTVGNVAPVLEVGEPDVAGRLVVIYGDVDDPGNDVITGTIDLGEGAGPRPLTDDELDDDWFTVEHTYAAAGAYTVVVVICDDDGGCATAELEITTGVDGNFAPVAVIDGPDEAAEGDAIDLSAEDSFDPDGAIVGYAWDLDGDGQYDDGTGATASLTAADDAVIDVGVRVVDDVGGAGTRRIIVEFVNVEPVVGPLAPVAIAAGGAIDVAGSFTDPGADEWTAEVDWGDGSPVEPLTLTGTTFRLAHTFSSAAVRTVVVEVCDDDDGCAETAMQVTVGDANRPPVATIDAPSTTAEGSTATFDAGASSDPDGAVAAWTWDLDGDSEFDDAVGATATLPCVDDGTIAAAVLVTDDDGATATATRTVECVNVAPTVAALAAAQLRPADRFTAAGSFTDPGADTFTGTVDWGEGGGAEPLALDGTGFTLDHVYAAAGTFTVAVVICDDDEECATGTGAITVTEETTPPAADLGAAVTLSEANPSPGADVIVAVAIRNAGPDDSGPVTATFELPAGLTFAGIAPGPSGLVRVLAVEWVCSVSPAPTCSAPNIAAGETTTLAVRLTLAAAATGTLAGGITVTAAVGDPNPADNTFPFELVVRRADPPATTAPPTTSSPTPTTTEPTAPPTTRVMPGGRLPVTGTDTTGPLQWALLLVAAGGVLLVVRRLSRRRP